MFLHPTHPMFFTQSNTGDSKLLYSAENAVEMTSISSKSHPWAIFFSVIWRGRRPILSPRAQLVRCVIEAIRVVYGKFDPSVNTKRLKILRSRLVYMITLRSWVVVQNLTKALNPFLARQLGQVSVFFLQAQFFFVSCTDHKYRSMLSIWSSKHVVSRTDVPFGG